MAASLASMTNTRVDSASKHIVPCKVNTDYMASLVGDNVDNSMRELQTNKMKYCMHKDDIVIGLGRPTFGASLNSNHKKAYPSVIVTLASMEDLARRWIALHNFMVRGYDDKDQLKKTFVQIVDAKMAGDSKKKSKIKGQVENMLDFYFVGISLGLAYAHPHSGDTVASVMIGGLRTVLNGHFKVHTNDLLMFYWPDELELFEENGGRRPRAILDTDGKKGDWIEKGKLQASDHFSRNMSQSAMDRKDYYGMRNGVFKNGPDGAHGGKQNVAMIKPYIVSRYQDPDDPTRVEHFPLDKCRVFGKAISNANPFEMVDVMLSRQAI